MCNVTEYLKTVLKMCGLNLEIMHIAAVNDC